MISASLLDHWIHHNRNVLFEGEAGVGKTSIILSAWKRHGIRYAYFSGSTMDPWVDFVGVPREVKDQEGFAFLDLIRPKIWAKDEIQAVFIDEYNRAPKKVRNAAMELIQFKSIYGKKFDNLRMIWTAINPENSDSNEYDVEPLDPAQRDRFHVQVNIPYECSLEYFTEQYDSNTAKVAIEWWNALPAGIKKKVSPRRLDYTLQEYFAGGDLKYVLPEGTNYLLLTQKIKASPVEDTINKFQQEDNKAGAAAWLKNENNYTASINTVLKRTHRAAFFIPLMPDEKIASLIATNDIAMNLAIAQYNSNPKMKEIVDNIISWGQNKAVTDKLNAGISQSNSVPRAKATDAIGMEKNPNASVFTPKMPNNTGYLGDLNLQNKKPSTNTVERLAIINALAEKMPTTLDKVEIEKTLDILNSFVLRSRPSTVRSIEILIPMVNHCMAQAELNGMQLTSIMTDYPELMGYVKERNSFYYKQK